MISLLIYLLVVGLIVGLIWYVCDALPIPQPLNKIIKLVAVVIGCLVVIIALLGLAGGRYWDAGHHSTMRVRWRPCRPIHRDRQISATDAEKELFDMSYRLWRKFNHNETMAVLVSALCAVMLSSLVIMSVYWDLAR